MINHYKILNIAENATEFQIRKAFRKLALKMHSDHTKAKDSHAFLQIKHSYDILIDHDKREVFDQQLNDSRNAKPQYSKVNLGKLNEAIYAKEKFGSKVFNFILKLALFAIFITVTTYSCNFINNSIFGSKKSFNNENINSIESTANSDSLRSEDLKFQKEFEATREKTQINGEIKF